TDRTMCQARDAGAKKYFCVSTFSQIAARYLESRGYEPYECESEDEARARVGELKSAGKYPVYFFRSDTTGEKDFEEFFTDKETLDMSRFKNLGVIKNGPVFEQEKLEMFAGRIREMRAVGGWTRAELIDLFNEMIPNFCHKETGKFLDGRM
ncbi:MAG: UDP-N-acetylglucosamine 4,6-dehydratase, partial [Treponemataceae bacterium]|nr:UDP-N-acetylglucosamine 4,6-dehydratase [Treponemataceae bacterium]